MTEYWAHSDPDGLPPEDPRANWQRLAAHLQNVSFLAGQLAESALPGDEDFKRAAELSGYLHDFGKYSTCFQKMITTGKGRCQHSAHGAAIAYAARYPDAAFGIAGHHAGIPDGTGATGTLEGRIREFREDAESLKARAGADLPVLRTFFAAATATRSFKTEEFDLRTRMLFSCLVDADRLDSGGLHPEGGLLNAKTNLEKLQRYIEEIAAKIPDGPVKLARREVLDDCLNAASYPERLLSLTVPTGGGKTLAAMGFALRRAALFPERYRRIIVVIPYLSIIEQNADVYARVFGADAVLEHHSGSFDRVVAGDAKHFVPGDSIPGDDVYQSADRRIATERWDAPLIVTTSVRFFESLFSNRPSDLRRVHNIAGSIVILDEVQALPRRLLAPLLNMIRELSERWGCTFVFSTATQPAFEKSASAGSKDSRWPADTVREIVRDRRSLHLVLRRVVIDWELDQTVTWAELAVRLVKEPSVLCVVNLREHASALFDEVAANSDVSQMDSLFHLSTRMCAAHRLEVLGQIRSRLKNGLPCRVISTQLVEAGVDLDFCVAYRALGPLDSVLQVAGRADREGLLTAKMGEPAGRVIVFRPEDEQTPPNEYREGTGLTGAMAREALALGMPIQPESVEQMDRYWNRYYGEGQEQGIALQEHRTNARFATLAREFEMISNRTLDVFVPFNDTARAAIAELRETGQLTKELRQRLQRYVVGLQPFEFEKARGVLEEIRKDSGVWVAVDQAYTTDKGFKLRLDATDNVL